MFQEINESTLKYLNALTDNESIKNFTIFMADSPIFFLPIFLISYWIYYTIKWTEDKKDSLLYIFYSTVLAVLINYFIKFFVDIDRPETILEATGRLILEHVPDKSFPSDHSSVAFSFVAWLYFFGYRKIALIFTPFVISMALSRVIAWVHWPFDVLAWAVVWVTSAFAIYKLSEKLEKTNSILRRFDFIYKIKKLINK